MSKSQYKYFFASKFLKSPSEIEVRDFGEENAYQLKELEADKKANVLFSAGTAACVGAGFTVADIITSDNTSLSESISFFVAPIITQLIVVSRTNLLYRRTGKHLKRRMADNKANFDLLTEENLQLVEYNTELQNQVNELTEQNERLNTILAENGGTPPIPDTINIDLNLPSHESEH